MNENVRQQYYTGGRISVPPFLLVSPAFYVEHDVPSTEHPLGQLGSAVLAFCPPQ